MNKVISIFSAAVLAFAISGCSKNSFPKELPVPTIPFHPVAPEVSREFQGAQISVDEVKDLRGTTALAADEKSSLEGKGDAAGEVKRALEQALRAHGFVISDSAPLIVSTELRKWTADVDRSFNSKSEASAALFIKVFNPANKLDYSGLYEGSADVRRGSIQLEDIEETLKTSMGEAIRQITLDKRLLKVLSSY